MLIASLASGTLGCRATAGGEPGLPSMFEPASGEALLLAQLSGLLIAIMAAVFAGVFIALLLIYHRYRARAADERGRPIYGSKMIEIAWTGAPAVILVGVFIVSIGVMQTVDPPPGQAAQVEGPPVAVEVVGHQWWWEYRLPEFGAATANELHLPLGRRAQLSLTAADVIHSFWIPQLQGKRDMIPGRVNVISFVPSAAGVFEGACTEYCGTQHAWMRLRVVVEPAEQFDAWARLQSQPAAAPRSALAQQGLQVFLDSSANCASCHTIRGTAANGQAGPDLTHLASRDTLAAGVLRNTPENLRRWIRTPQQVKPGSLMPDSRLSDQDLEALVAYLSELR